MKTPLSIFVLVLTAAGSLAAEVKLSNPGFSPRESSTYTETIGSVVRTVETSLTLTGEGAAARYEYRSKAPDLEALYRLDPATLVSLSSESTTLAPDATVVKTAEYRNLRPKAGPDDLVVTDLGSLPAALRGFPWGRTGTVKFLYVGNTSFGGTAVTFELTVTGREVVTAAGRSWDCWHATTGLGGAFSLVMAKTDWWFAAEGSHPLIKTSGPSGGPGSPLRTLVLQAWKRD